jgi:uncharacterized tellurite resistance protein B-like protein
MYMNLLKTQEEGMCHLLYHCCMRDGVFKESELDNIAGKLVAIELQSKLNFRDEMQKYKSYRADISDEQAYVQYLIGLIKPVNELALFSWCIELCLTDGHLSAEEDHLLKTVAAELNVDESTQLLIQKLMVQRRIVEVDKLF